ncbi:MAG: hypothetical protein EP343_18665 [Deltaproteobacteria bacterium]|nr:MAG: hypothetical protein EP343_18665 [Deltaproteobacteria bacterium]
MSAMNLPPTWVNSKHRMLVFDSGETAPGSLMFLQELERMALSIGEAEQPHRGTHEPYSFLRRANVLAGTGMGALSALYLAVTQQLYPNWTPLVRISRCIDFYVRFMEHLQWKPFSVIPALTGVTSLRCGYEAERLLEKEFGKTRTFADLNPRVKVGVVTISLKDQCNLHVYSNFDDSENANVRLVDAAMRSLAFPVNFPIWQGHIAGSIVSNNPSTIILSSFIQSTLHSCRKVADPELSPCVTSLLNETRMVSLGMSFRSLMNSASLNAKLEQPQTSWGYLQWNLLPQQPFAWVDASEHGGVTGNATYCHMLLNRARFLRLGYHFPVPSPGRFSLWSRFKQAICFHRRKYEAEVHETREFVLDWLEGQSIHQFNCGVSHKADKVYQWLQNFDWLRPLPSEAHAPPSEQEPSTPG